MDVLSHPRTRQVMFSLALYAVAFFLGALLAPVSFALEGGLLSLITVILISRSIEWSEPHRRPA